MKHGDGKYTWANGSCYEGPFREDKKHGKGTIVHENGKTSHLEWRDGQVVGDLEEGHREKHVVNVSSIRNANKNLPANKKYASSKEKTNNVNPNLINNDGFNRLRHSQSSGTMPKGVSFRQQPHE